MRRLLQAQGAEVIHLGHDRSVEDVVTAALQEDADAVAVSSYQGGHVEFFRYLVDRLRERGAGHIRVYGGGGGAIMPRRSRELHARGVARIFRPEDGQTLGLEGMIARCSRRASARPEVRPEAELARLSRRVETLAIARADLGSRHGGRGRRELEALRRAARARRRGAPRRSSASRAPAARASRAWSTSCVRRFALAYPERERRRAARRSDAAPHGRRAARRPHPHERDPSAAVFVRSLATRRAHLALSARASPTRVRVLQAAGFDLILVETAGIGQSDSEIVDLVDLSRLRDDARVRRAVAAREDRHARSRRLVVLNKFDRRGGEDALRDVRKQWRRNRAAFDAAPTTSCRCSRPSRAAGTIRASTRVRRRSCGMLAARRVAGFAARAASSGACPQREPDRARRAPRYLAEIAERVRGYRERRARHRARSADEASGSTARCARSTRCPSARRPATRREPPSGARLRSAHARRRSPRSSRAAARASSRTGPSARALPPSSRATVRGARDPVENYARVALGLAIPQVALPRRRAGASSAALPRAREPARAASRSPRASSRSSAARGPDAHVRGRGPPERTNRRFHCSRRAAGGAALDRVRQRDALRRATRTSGPTSTARSATRASRSARVDDAKKLYSGFDLCAPNTSVSMTINGPAPIVLAFFLNAAIDQAVERHLRETRRARATRRALAGARPPRYEGALPAATTASASAARRLGRPRWSTPRPTRASAPTCCARVRGTVQADILKEDQAQNTCIFSTEFALRLMGDVQEYFIAQRGARTSTRSRSPATTSPRRARTRSPSSPSRSPTASPTASTTSRAAWRSTTFAPNFSFFFSNGLDAEYAVIGRVARRIWAIALRERYGAAERSQKLKYHVQTSGRSLHAQEMASTTSAPRCRRCSRCRTTATACTPTPTTRR